MYRSSKLSVRLITSPKLCCWIVSLNRLRPLRLVISRPSAPHFIPNVAFTIAYESVKPWKGLGSGVMEIVSDYDTNTYRAIYTVNIGDVIYVLHAFQKKSKSGIGTPKEEIETINTRYKKAVELSKKKKR